MLLSPLLNLFVVPAFWLLFLPAKKEAGTYRRVLEPVGVNGTDPLAPLGDRLDDEDERG